MSSPLSKQYHKYEINIKKHLLSKQITLLTYEYSSTATKETQKITSQLKSQNGHLMKVYLLEKLSSYWKADFIRKSDNMVRGYTVINTY